MLKIRYLLTVVLMITTGIINGQTNIESDSFTTPSGELLITAIGHGTLMIQHENYVIHVDPVSREADYSLLPDADLVLITHAHGDHLDPAALKEITSDKTIVACNASSAAKLNDPVIMKNGDEMIISEYIGTRGVVTAVPAYNIKHERSPGNPFHPKGDGNGYVIDLDGFRIYIGGDTENVPEMAQLKDIDVAFLPMNLPYTMTPEMVADAAKMFRPAILYPYHFGSTDTGELIKLLEGSGIEVRIRNF